VKTEAKKETLEKPQKRDKDPPILQDKSYAKMTLVSVAALGLGAAAIYFLRKSY
jgi:hypothetical protein